MTPQQKRTTWLLIAIALFFANLTLGAVMLIKVYWGGPAAPAASRSAETEPGK